VLARKSLSKYEADLRAVSPRLAGDSRLVPLLKARRWKDAEYLLADELEPLAVDFLQVYEERDNTWHLRAQVADTAVTAPGAFSDDLMRRALESGDAMRSEAGYVALPIKVEKADRKAAAAGNKGDVRDSTTSSEAAGIVIVAGYWLGEDFFANVREVTDARLYYGQLEIYKRVAKQSVWVTGAILFGVAAVISLLVAALLARQLSKPILGLTEGMKRVAAGKLDEKVVVSASGEIGYLVDSFNRMTQDLKVYKEQLARAERIAAWQEVARYVAHEIRNPLTPVKVSLHRLRTCLEQLDEEQKRRFSDSLDSILVEIGSLERLATAFSEFAKLPEPVLAPVDINRIVKEVAELYQPRREDMEQGAQESPRKGAGQVAQETPREAQREAPLVRIDLLLDGSLPKVSADAQQIRMAFLNIVKNAVESMPEGGALEISSRRGSVTETQSRSGALSGEGARGFVEIAFKDTGCGIPEALIGKVMTPHFTTKKGGTGLGLAVVSKIVSQHGGRVFIQSREAKGTLVRIVLPTQPLIPGAAQRTAEA
jgi:nitrogen fixation/metabolism regulation signal transduction histidine kinase